MQVALFILNFPLPLNVSFFLSSDEYCVCSPSLAIDVIIETDDSIVVVRRVDNGKYATIGGFVQVFHLC